MVNPRNGARGFVLADDVYGIWDQCGQNIFSCLIPVAVYGRAWVGSYGQFRDIGVCGLVRDACHFRVQLVQQRADELLHGRPQID
jgi:hypothetical protein